MTTTAHKVGHNFLPGWEENILIAGMMGLVTEYQDGVFKAWVVSEAFKSADNWFPCPDYSERSGAALDALAGQETVVTTVVSSDGVRCMFQHKGKTHETVPFAHASHAQAAVLKFVLLQGHSDKSRLT